MTRLVSVPSSPFQVGLYPPESFTRAFEAGRFRADICRGPKLLEVIDARTRVGLAWGIFRALGRARRGE